jgi:hypothetical protein
MGGLASFAVDLGSSDLHLDVAADFYLLRL